MVAANARCRNGWAALRLNEYVAVFGERFVRGDDQAGPPDEAGGARAVRMHRNDMAGGPFDEGGDGLRKGGQRGCSHVRHRWSPGYVGAMCATWAATATARLARAPRSDVPCQRRRVPGLLR